MIPFVWLVRGCNGKTLMKNVYIETSIVSYLTARPARDLLTWNCRHIDNAELKPLMRSVCVIHGYTCPEICTPLELMGEDDAG